MLLTTRYLGVWVDSMGKSHRKMAVMRNRSLYKYIPFYSDKNGRLDNLNEKRLDGFKEQKIWFSRALDVNDPFDCYPTLLFSVDTIEEIIEGLDEEDVRFLKTKIRFDDKTALLAKVHSPDSDKGSSEALQGAKLYRFGFRLFVHQLRAAKMKNVALLSLSSDPLNILMWSHYGGHHQGICIEFALNGVNLERARKVKYRRCRPQLQILDTMSEARGKFDEMFLTKSHHWRYEKEWRILRGEGAGLYDLPGTISRVLLGVNCSKETERTLRTVFGSHVSYPRLELTNTYSLKDA